jgi:hypothetical protein
MGFHVCQAVSTSYAVCKSSAMGLARPSACALGGVYLGISESRTPVAHADLVRGNGAHRAADRNRRGRPELARPFSGVHVAGSSWRFACSRPANAASLDSCTPKISASRTILAMRATWACSGGMTSMR